jgi:hypothetical protein
VVTQESMARGQPSWANRATDRSKSQLVRHTDPLTTGRLDVRLSMVSRWILDNTSKSIQRTRCSHRQCKYHVDGTGSACKGPVHMVGAKAAAKIRAE